MVDRVGAARLTIDIDGSVVSTGLKAEGARCGYSPHRRKAPSYYPIGAYETNSGVMLNVLNRSGNVHDGKAWSTRSRFLSIPGSGWPIVSSQTNAWGRVDDEVKYFTLRIPINPGSEPSGSRSFGGGSIIDAANTSSSICLARTTATMNTVR